MKSLYLLILAFYLLALNVFSQEGYFQQEVNYKINVRLNDQKHELSAFIEMEYVNNSPDTLSFIYMHLWPNAYKNNQTALAKQKLSNGWTRLFKDENRRGFIDSLDFKVNELPILVEYDQTHIDICKLNLNEPIKPGQSIRISTPFRVKIPKGNTSRLGHIGQSYQLTQWYPKPAVYDAFGWHQMPYLDMGEFYSEFGSYDVHISLPENYVLGATGDLQNEEEIKWLTERAAETSKMTSFSRLDSFPESSGKFKTIHYKQENVHDFAWFADKRFHVLKGQQKLPHSGRPVTTWAMFLNREAHLWQRSLEYINDALYYYSLWYGDYPYNNCTAVHSALSAGAGMEYPNITVIGNSGTALQLEMVIMHEVGHNWFYGVLGFNEREFPWMDEGINSFSEARYMRTKYKGEDRISKLLPGTFAAKLFDLESFPYKTYHQFMYLLSARRNLDQAASLSSEEFTAINYGAIVYSKVSRIFDHLYGFLGEEKFDSIMRAFFEEWKFKHPSPEDIRMAFEKGSGENLAWLFDDLLTTTKKLDYKLLKKEGKQLKVKNTGQIIAPFSVSGIKGDSIRFTKWYPGFEGKKIISLPDDERFDFLALDYEMYMPEFNRKNNFLKSKGLFKRIEPAYFRFFGIAEMPHKTQFNLMPVMGWNKLNAYMLGLNFYSPIIPGNLFSYQFMPMYSFGKKDLAGSALFSYHILPYDGIFRDLHIEVSGIQYAYGELKGENFNRLNASLKAVFNASNLSRKEKNWLEYTFTMATDLTDVLSHSEPSLQLFHHLAYRYQTKHSIMPSAANAALQWHKDFLKLSAEYSINKYFSYSKRIDFRFYAAFFLHQSASYLPVYNHSLSGTVGINDYTYNHTYLARFESPEDNSFLGNQFVPDQGGFSVPAPFTISDWISSLNVSSSVPGLPEILRLKVYSNIAFFGETNNPAIDSYFEWEVGVKYSVGNDVLCFYFPLWMSDNLQKYNDQIRSNYIERIRFSLNLNKINPFKLIDSQF